MTLDQDEHDRLIQSAKDETKRKILMDIIDVIDSDFKSRSGTKIRNLRNRVKRMYEGI